MQDARHRALRTTHSMRGGEGRADLFLKREGINSYSLLSISLVLISMIRNMVLADDGAIFFLLFSSFTNLSFWIDGGGH